ncbi:MAG: protein-disulfide reductase DsbD N-terminal domain-containing protein, partial [Tepidisphaeraceae bacterium]
MLHPIQYSALLALLCLCALPHPASAQERLTGQLLLNTTALKPGGDHVAAVVFDIADKFHAQSHKPLDEFAVPFDVAFDKTPGLTLGNIQFPPGIVHEYKALGKISVYEGHTVIFVPINVDASAKPGPITLSAELSYQICDDKACFQPEDKPVTLKTEIVPPGQDVQPANPEIFKSYKPGPATKPAAAPTAPTVTPKPPQAQPPVVYGSEYKPGSVLGAFGLAFLVGIIFNIMPCVLPVLPLKIIGFYEVSQHNRSRTVFLAGIFSIGVIAVFILLALLVPV